MEIGGKSAERSLHFNRNIPKPLKEMLKPTDLGDAHRWVLLGMLGHLFLWSCLSLGIEWTGLQSALSQTNTPSSLWWLSEFCWPYCFYFLGSFPHVFCEVIISIQFSTNLLERQHPACSSLLGRGIHWRLPNTLSLSKLNVVWDEGGGRDSSELWGCIIRACLS